LSESLEQTVARVSAAGPTASHLRFRLTEPSPWWGMATCLRALAMLLEGLREEQISQLEIGNGEVRCCALGTSRDACLQDGWRPTTQVALSNIL
jgi:hypothetical protein